PAHTRPPLFPYTTLFRSEARALTNLIGNGVATMVVAKWCRALDDKRMHRHLDAETVAEAEDPEQVLVEEEEGGALAPAALGHNRDRKSTRLNSSHDQISY